MTPMDDKQIFLSTDLAHRLAAIDIGSNSVRLMVAEPLKGGNYRILDEERESTRLGRTLSSTGTLAAEAVELTLAALRRFKQIAAGYQVDELRTIATCAVREAVNGPEFCRRVKDEVGIDVEVISADQEAHLAFYSVQRAFDLNGKNVVVADIGGGSTEIVLASGNVIESIATTPLGAVRLTEIYGNGPGMAGSDYEQMIEAIDRTLKKQIRRALFPPHLLIGSGGTFTAMAEMMMASRRQVGLPTRGYLLSRAEISHMLDRLRKMPLKTRRQVPGLAPDRADIIVAGIAVVDQLDAPFQSQLVASAQPRRARWFAFDDDRQHAGCAKYRSGQPRGFDRSLRRRLLRRTRIGAWKTSRATGRANFRPDGRALRIERRRSSAAERRRTVARCGLSD